MKTTDIKVGHTYNNGKGRARRVTSISCVNGVVTAEKTGDVTGGCRYFDRDSMAKDLTFTCRYTVTS